MKKASFTFVRLLRCLCLPVVAFFAISEVSAQALACNDQVNISIPAGATCSVTIVPDMVTENDDSDGYLEIRQGSFLIASGIAADSDGDGDFDSDDDSGLPTDSVGVVIADASDLLGIPLIYRYYGPGSTGPGGNFCWGNVVLEDKSGPALTGTGDVTIDCDEALPVPGVGVVATDNCEIIPAANVQLVSEVIVDADPCDDGNAVIVRTYVAFDAAGNASNTATQTITIERAAAPGFPDDIQYSCVQYNADPNITDIGPLRSSVAAIPLTPISNAPGAALIRDVTPFDPIITAGNFAGEVAVASGLYCGYAVSSSDDTLAVCAASSSTFKILRTFNVLDWCTGVTTTDVQLIKVVDNIAPTTAGITGPITASANIPGQHPQPCLFTGAIPAPIYTDACADVPAAVTLQAIIYRDLDGDGILDAGEEDASNVAGSAQSTNNGMATVTAGLMLGNYIVRFTGADACGNVSLPTDVALNVVDNTIPTPVCDEITQITLTNAPNGLTTVPATVFDDGSYDNCCLEGFLVRRLSDAMAPIADADPSDDDIQIINAAFDDGFYGSSVAFDCDDTGSNMVELLVYDCFGNFNTCMVEVLVEDKSLVNIQCPTAVSGTCLQFNSIAAQLEALEDGTSVGELAQLALIQQTFGFGTATGFGALCGQTDNVDVSFSLTNCDDTAANGVTITFTTTANSNPANNQSVTCFIPLADVVDWEVSFPGDQTLFCTNTSGFSVDLDDLDAQFGTPEFFNLGCPQQLAYNEDVEVFTSSPDACYKIVRTFTAINWCEAVAPFLDVNGGSAASPYLDGDDADNRFNFAQIGPDNVIRYTQVIKINDNVAPVVATPVAVPDVAILTGGPVFPGAPCVGNAVLTRPTADDCVDDDDLTYAFLILDATGSVVQAGTFSGLQQTTVTLVPGTYSVTYEVSDMCGNSTIVSGGTFDVADGKKPTPICMNGVIIGIMQTGMVTVGVDLIDKGSFDACSPVILSFTSTADGSAPTTSVTYTCADIGDNPITLYVKDAAGNEDFCTTFVRVEDNMGVCGGGVPLVSGGINTEMDQPVENVEVDINALGTTLTTNANGTFDVNVDAGSDISLVPSKNNDAADNGVTTLDIVAINRHILGLQSLDTPYKRIAADANGTGNITALDVVQIRRVILHLDDEFAVGNWRFVDADYAFSTATPEGEAFPEVINLNNVAGDVAHADFVAVKVGDVNGNASTTNLHGAATEDRTAGTYVLNVADRAVKAGEIFSVEFTSADMDVFGYQFTMNYAGLELVDFAGNVATEDNFGFAYANEGMLTASWDGEAAAGSQFSLTFKADNAGQLSEMLTVGDQLTRAEAYTRSGKLNVELNFNGAASSEFVLFQNTPNPFSAETRIAFNLPVNGDAVLTIQDVSGKVLYNVAGTYAKGYNEVTVSADQLPATGILYYTLRAGEHVATNRMVLSK